MANDAKGRTGIGVLRMDVDNLGQVIVNGLRSCTMTSASALSSALHMFFAGHLNLICSEIQKNRLDCLYVIYSGGDDLFIVGAWDLMPELAEKIQTDFFNYTDKNPSLTISGAVTLEDSKFPLYQAAERAGAAEERAKDYQRKTNGLQKNAFHFLGMEVGWEEWPVVVQHREDLQVALANGASKALIHTLLDIYSQFESRKKERGTEFGPWLWRGAYFLNRLASRIPCNNTKGREAITNLAKSCLDPQKIRFAGLAARWMELLTRKEQ